MFGLGIWEIAVIAVVALLVLGPEKLPDAARSIGKALRDFRRAGDDIKREMLGDLDEHPRPRPPVAKPVEGAIPQASVEPPPAPVEPPKDPEPKA